MKFGFLFWSFIFLFFLSLGLSFIKFLIQPFPYPILIFIFFSYIVTIFVLSKEDFKKHELQFSTNAFSNSIVLDGGVRTLKNDWKVAKLGAYKFGKVLGGSEGTVIFDNSLIEKKDKLFASKFATIWSFNYLPLDIRKELIDFGCVKFPLYIILPEYLFDHSSLDWTSNKSLGCSTLNYFKTISQDIDLLDSHLEKIGNRVENFNDSSFFTYENLLQKVGEKNIEKIAKVYMKQKQKDEENLS